MDQPPAPDPIRSLPSPPCDIAHQSPASEPLSLPFIPWLTLHSPLGVLRTPSWAGQLLRGSRGTGRGREGLQSSSCSVTLSSLNHLERMLAFPWACLPVQDGHPEKDQLASQRATRGQYHTPATWSRVQWVSGTFVAAPRFLHFQTHVSTKLTHSRTFLDIWLALRALHLCILHMWEKPRPPRQPHTVMPLTILQPLTRFIPPCSPFQVG